MAVGRVDNINKISNLLHRQNITHFKIICHQFICSAPVKIIGLTANFCMVLYILHVYPIITTSLVRISYNEITDNIISDINPYAIGSIDSGIATCYKNS